MLHTACERRKHILEGLERLWKSEGFALQLAVQSVPKRSGLAKSVTFKLFPQDVSGRGDNPIWFEVELSLLMPSHTQYLICDQWDVAAIRTPGSTSKVPYGHTFWNVAEGLMVPMAMVQEPGTALGLLRSKSILSPCTKWASYLCTFRQTHELGWSVTDSGWQQWSGLHCFHCLKHVLSCFPTHHPNVKCHGGDLVFS